MGIPHQQSDGIEEPQTPSPAHELPVNNKQFRVLTTRGSQSIIGTDRDSDVIDYEGQLSDSPYSDSYDDDRSISFMEIPGFPMPPALIPTPSYNVSPPPNVPCPPLPAYFSPPSRHLGFTLTSGLGNQKANLTSTSRFIRDGDIEFSGLEVAILGTRTSYSNATARASTTCSDPFDLDQEYTQYSVPTTRVLAVNIEHHNAFSALPNMSTVNLVYRHLPVTVLRPEGTHHSHDTCIGQSVPDGSATRNNAAPASFSNVNLPPGLRTMSVFEDDNPERLEGIIDTTEKATNTNPRSDESFSHVLSASQYHRVATGAHQAQSRSGGANPVFAMDERKAYVEERNIVCLQRALEPAPARTASSEVEGIERIALDAMSDSSGYIRMVSHDRALVGEPRRIGNVQKPQRHDIRYPLVTMHRSCGWCVLGILGILVLSGVLVMLLFVYPSGLQKALNDTSKFGLSHVSILEPSPSSFGLTIDFMVVNEGRIAGELEPMVADLRTRSISNSSNSNSAFLHRRARELMRRATLTETDPAAIYLQRLDMPSIEFSDDQKARIVQAPKSYVNRTDGWGDLLAKVFNRQDDVAIEFDGRGIFKKGAMRMKMQLSKSISLLHIPIDEFTHRTKTGIVDWKLQEYNRMTQVVKLNGRSQFLNPGNITMYLGDCTFELVHRNVVIGVLKVPDYLLVPGLNNAVTFSADVNVHALSSDQRQLGSFLSTLMIWDPLFLHNSDDHFFFQVIGKSASINGTEISWLSKAVQGINDTIYVLSNSKNGTTDVSYLTTDLMLEDLQIDLSELKSENGTLTTNMRGGYLSLNVKYPVTFSEFPITMVNTSHSLELIEISQNKNKTATTTYARLEIPESAKTVSWTDEISTPDGRERTLKHLSVDLKRNNATLTILDSEAFARVFFRPWFNGMGVRVNIKGIAVMSVDTPLGICKLEPMPYVKSIWIEGKSILERSQKTMILSNIALTNGY